ncbi:MAG: hypothetical protein WA958_01115 [Tunicatimonas sp.]
MFIQLLVVIRKMKILRYIGIAFLIALGVLIGLFIFLSIIFSSDEVEVNYKRLIKSERFNELHEAILKIDSVRNIAVLPEEQYIVIDGIVINQSKRTYGIEPELEFYFSYYQEGDKIAYASLDSLLAMHDIKFDSVTALPIISKMKECHLSDIAISKSTISYRWRVSAMYGEEGIIYSQKTLDKDSSRYDVFERMEGDFYHFAVYD